MTTQEVSGWISSRREFLDLSRQWFVSATALALCPLSLSARDIEELKLKHLDPPTGLLLTHTCRLLFPHDSLQEKVYIEVVKDIDASLGASEEAGALIKKASGDLNRDAGGDWMKASVEQQLSILQAHQQSDWFRYLRERTIESLYRNPVVWKLVGYEGSSIEHGGYLNRGFDDIDWL